MSKITPRDPILLEALEEYSRVKDVAKMTEEQRELVINYEEEMVTFVNDHIAWMNALEPKIISPDALEDTPPHVVHLSIIASLSRMSAYILQDSPLNIKGNTHIRNPEDYSTCHFCYSEVSDLPSKQRHKLKYSKKEKVKSDLFYVVCKQCLKFAKAMRNIKFVMTCIQRCDGHAVNDMVEQLDEDREFVDLMFLRLRGSIAQNK